MLQRKGVFHSEWPDPWLWRFAWLVGEVWSRAWPMAALTGKAAWHLLGWVAREEAFSEDSLSSVVNVRANSLFATLVILRHLLRIVSCAEACSQCVKKGH